MAENSKIVIRLSDVNKNYGDTRIVRHLNLNITEGEFLTLLGPSGCGKTTTLRMIAGFETVTDGIIELYGENVENKKPNERDVNTVFQNYALFPHMTVEKNIAFGLVEKKVPKAEIKERVAEMIKLVQLEGMESRMPSQLSGGQKQRVAIARALVNRPRVLLLDEPLGALDLKLRKQMQFELKHLQKKLGITFIYVTHDQEEALTMSDRIAVMNGGILEQIGTPEEIYNHPKTKFVADFIGESNILDGYVEEEIKGDRVTVEFECGKCLMDNCGFVPEEMIYLCIRPENLRLSTSKIDSFELRGKVKEHIFVGSSIKTIIETVNEQELKAVSPPDTELIPVGTEIYLYWRDDKAVVLRTYEEQLYNVIESNAEKTFDSYKKK